VTASVRLQDRLREISLPGLQLGTKEPREVRERLTQIAQYVVDQELGRTTAAAKRKPARGRPKSKAMREVFGGLTVVWLDYSQAVAGVSYFWCRRDTEGSLSVSPRISARHSRTFSRKTRPPAA
jgi:hypothetical protein